MTEQNEQKLEQSLAYLEMVKAQLESLQSQSGLIAESILERQRVKETLTNYKILKANEELLVPIGAGVFLFVKVGDASKALIEIGGEVAIEKPIEPAIEKIDDSIKDLEETGKKIDEKLQALQQQATVLTGDIQDMYGARAPGKI